MNLTNSIILLRVGPSSSHFTFLRSGLFIYRRKLIPTPPTSVSHQGPRWGTLCKSTLDILMGMLVIAFTYVPVNWLLFQSNQRFSSRVTWKFLKIQMLRPHPRLIKSESQVIAIHSQVKNQRIKYFPNSPDDKGPQSSHRIYRISFPREGAESLYFQQAPLAVS